MAVAAIQAQPAYVVFVTKRNGLLARHILASLVRRSNYHGGSPDSKHAEEEGPEENQPEQRISPWRKVSCHLLFLLIAKRILHVEIHADQKSAREEDDRSRNPECIRLRKAHDSS